MPGEDTSREASDRQHSQRKSLLSGGLHAVSARATVATASMAVTRHQVNAGQATLEPTEMDRDQHAAPRHERSPTNHSKPRCDDRDDRDERRDTQGKETRRNHGSQRSELKQQQSWRATTKRPVEDVSIEQYVTNMIRAVGNYRHKYKDVPEVPTIEQALSEEPWPTMIRLYAEITPILDSIPR